MQVYRHQKNIVIAFRRSHQAAIRPTNTLMHFFQLKEGGLLARCGLPSADAMIVLGKCYWVMFAQEFSGEILLENPSENGNEISCSLTT